MSKRLIFFIIAAALQMLPQAAFSQDTDVFVDPNQPKIDSLLAAVKPDSPDSVKAWNYSRVSYITCDLDTSLKYAFLSLDYCTEDNPKRDELLPYNYNNIAFAYYMKDESRKALHYRLLSARIYHQTADKKREAGTFIHIGNCYLDLNIKDSIFYYYNKAIVILTEIKDTNFLIDAYNNLGQIYGTMSLHDNAIENYRKGLDYALALNNTLRIACGYCFLGASINMKSDTSFYSAIENLTKSVRLFESMNTQKHYDVEYKHHAYKELASAYIKAAKQTNKKAYADSCYKYVTRAGNYYKSVGSYNNFVSCRFCYVDYLVFNKRYADALSELLGLGKYLTDDHLMSVYQNYYRYLYEVYSHLGDYRNALYCHEKYMDCKMAYLNDSTLNSIKDGEVERARMLDSVSHQLETLRIETEHQKQLRQKQLYIRIVGSLAIFVLMLAVVFFFYYKTIKESEENKLRADALEIERTLLRTQMNPHFIFNALNSIQSFITSNNQGEAVRYLSKFAKLMRMILNNSMQQYVLLSEELASLSLYLDLEQVRFNNRFSYKIDIDDEVEEDLVKVPPMLIQPFVENAILHGLMHKPEGGLITICLAENGNNTLTCTITDNGVGRKAAAEIESKNEHSHKSVGMQLTRDRLQELNRNTQHSCAITDLEDSDGNALGTQVIIIIPEQV
ncbi:MAG: histidine kinase [Salinivirgaceae bacterium]|nr:histidine kinase [Salinivirgaceae bacterium]